MPSVVPFRDCSEFIRCSRLVCRAKCWSLFCFDDDDEVDDGDALERRGVVEDRDDVPPADELTAGDFELRADDGNEPEKLDVGMVDDGTANIDASNGLLSPAANPEMTHKDKHVSYNIVITFPVRNRLNNTYQHI